LNRVNIINYIFKISSKNGDNDVLIKAIEQAKLELEAARSSFNNAEDFNLIDAAIFSEEAAKKRYDYYLSIAKSRGLRVSNYYVLEHCTELYK